MHVWACATWTGHAEAAGHRSMVAYGDVLSGGNPFGVGLKGKQKESNG